MKTLHCLEPGGPRVTGLLWEGGLFSSSPSHSFTCGQPRSKSVGKVFVTQLCPTLCDALDCTSVYGILQARILEGVDIPYFRDLPNPGIEPRSPVSQANSLLSVKGSPNPEACPSGYVSFRWAQFILSPKCHYSRGSQCNSVRLIRFSMRIRKYRKFCKFLYT